MARTKIELSLGEAGKSTLFNKMYDIFTMLAPLLALTSLILALVYGFVGLTSDVESHYYKAERNVLFAQVCAFIVLASALAHNHWGK